MSTDITINVEIPANHLRLISSGSDGDALVGSAASEIRVLNRVSAARLTQLKRQLSLLPLVCHVAIRPLMEPRIDGDPPAFQLHIPRSLDPLQDRLSERLASLSELSRFRAAASIVDATFAAHRVGLYHGTFAASTILVDDSNDVPQVFIDFTSMSFAADVGVSTLTVEEDLIGLRSLFAWMLADVVEGPEDSVVARQLGGRQRAILSQWIHGASEKPSRIAPTVGQWRAFLEPFSVRPVSDDQTGIAMAPVIAAGTSSTSRMTRDRLDEARVEAMPDQLGRFRLDTKIGEGGMGSVYRATDMASGEVVAVKVMRKTGNDVAQAIRRFRKEARVLAEVQNEFVTRLIEVGEDGGLHFLAMEFVNGIDLKSWLAVRCGLPESVALKLMSDLTRSLVDAHAIEVIHRDIKPENILLRLRDDAVDRGQEMVQRPIEDFTLKLTDFGIARQINQSESMEMTRAGTVMGTPKYMSPEQCKSAGELGPAADVYSLGVTMFELLTGGVPFNSDDFMKLAAMHCFDPVPSVQKRNAAITDGADRIVQRAMAKDPAQRFGDAGQMLAELLKLIHGEAADMQAHPKLPSGHSAAKVWDKSMSWELDSKSKSLWPLVSNTERLNEAIGLPAVDYRTEKDPELGIRKFGSFTLSGIKVSWEEHPFEWIEGRRMGILREFGTGPFKWFMSVVTLEPSANGGTTLTHQVRIEPRNFFGRVLTTIEADWKGFRNLERVYRRMDRSIQGRLNAEQGHDPFSKIKTMSRQQSDSLDQRIELVCDAGVDPGVAGKLRQAIREGSAQELASIRPLAMADRLSVAGPQMIDACLIAAEKGILNLRWEVLCPTCRASATTEETLARIDAHTHCEACDVDFQSNLAGSIEMVFQAHPEIRQVNEGQYCIGGPEHSPHVVAQVRVDAGECLVLSLDLDVGDYLIRGPRLPHTQSIRVQSSAAPSAIDFSLSTLGDGNHTPKLRSGRQAVTLANDLDTLHVLRVERMIPRGDVVTAAIASTNPLFRKLFPHQQFAGDNPIASETMTFVATSINNIDELYSALGDTEAYNVVHRHHQWIARDVAAKGGTIVKTIGEKTLAAFNVRGDALAAVQAIRGSLMNFATPALRVGIGIHAGPTLVTTANNQLDYFGGTVRAVSGLPELADNDTLVTESIYAEAMLINASHTPHEMPLSKTVEMVDLPGSPQHRVKRIVTKKAEINS